MVKSASFQYRVILELLFTSMTLSEAGGGATLKSLDHSWAVLNSHSIMSSDYACNAYIEILTIITFAMTIFRGSYSVERKEDSH